MFGLKLISLSDTCLTWMSSKKKLKGHVVWDLRTSFWKWPDARWAHHKKRSAMFDSGVKGVCTARRDCLPCQRSREIFFLAVIVFHGKVTGSHCYENRGQAPWSTLQQRAFVGRRRFGCELLSFTSWDVQWFCESTFHTQGVEAHTDGIRFTFISLWETVDGLNLPSVQMLFCVERKDIQSNFLSLLKLIILKQSSRHPLKCHCVWTGYK